MDRMHRLGNGLRIGMVAASVAVLVAICSCTYVDPSGRRHTLTPYDPGGGVPGGGWRVIGCFNDGGQTYCLIDTDGDGTADVVRRMSDGRLYQIEDPFNVNPDWLNEPEPDPEPSPSTDRVDPVVWAVAELSYVMVSQGLPWELQQVVALYDGCDDAPSQGWCDVPFHYDFAGMTSAEALADMGLDIEPGTTVEIDNLRLRSFDTKTYHTVIELYTSSAFEVPRVYDHGLSEHMMYAIQGPTEDDPWFVALRVEGDVAQVASYLAAAGSESFEFDGTDGDTWTIAIEGQSAVLYHDGDWFDEIPIG